MVNSGLLSPFLDWIGASTANKILFALVSWFFYVAWLCIYRLYLSPLAKFPGPKIAAVTGWYALYYDILFDGGGQYIWEVKAMHEKYGPIVRIKPDTLHFNDPEAIDIVLAGAGKRREKSQPSVNSFMASYSGVGTKDHDLHKLRRVAVNPFFSKQSVRRVEPITQRTLRKLLNRMEVWGAAGEPAPMLLAYKATTTDIINDYSFEGIPNALDKPDMNAPLFEALSGSVAAQIGTYFPAFVVILKKLPPAFILFLQPTMLSFIRYQDSLGKQIDRVRGEKPDPDGKPTIFTSLLNGNLPESEKKTERLKEEAYVIVIAGTDTTATTLGALTYHLLANPRILNKLKTELETAMPDPNEPPTLALETLPYLTAVIQEIIRLHPGVVLRQERVAPDEAVFYEAPDGKKYKIPKGTALGMTAPLLSRNPDIYPSPNEFRPERYLENPRLTRYQIAFSKGTRACLGINLAYQELYLLTAGIFRKYSLYDGTGKQTVPTLELYETTRADVSLAADYMTPGVRGTGKGVRLMIRN